MQYVNQIYRLVTQMGHLKDICRDEVSNGKLAIQQFNLALHMTSRIKDMRKAFCNVSKTFVETIHSPGNVY